MTDTSTRPSAADLTDEQLLEAVRDRTRTPGQVPSPAILDVREAAALAAARNTGPTPGQVAYETHVAVVAGPDHAAYHTPWDQLRARTRANWEMIAAAGAAAHQAAMARLRLPRADALARAAYHAHAHASGVPDGRLNWSGTGSASRRAWRAAAKAVVDAAVLQPCAYAAGQAATTRDCGCIWCLADICAPGSWRS